MNSYLPSVNQKRLFAALLVEQAQSVEEQRHLKQALLEGATSHLVQAFRFYLGEVAEMYQVADSSAVTSPDELVSALAAAGKTPAEATEIQAASKNRDTWLNQLLVCGAAVRQLPKASSSREGENLISAVTVEEDQDWSRLESAQVSSWLDAFNEMVERHRESMVEC